MTEEFTALEEDTAALLDSIGFKSKFLLSPIAAGGNNRVLRIEMAGGPFLLKSYFSDLADARDRGGNEFRFSSYVWNLGVDCIPEPLVYDAAKRLGIYRFVDGIKLRAGEVKRIHLDQALEFFTRINSAAINSTFPQQQTASEACFTLRDHISIVERRIESLRSGINPDQSLEDREAAMLVAGRLTEVWSKVRQVLDKRSAKLGLKHEQGIPLSSLCISASDFGFHNALITKEDKVIFIDFEYAGLDDRAKMLCDFFCQPQVPIGLDYFDEMMRGVILEGPDRIGEMARVAALFPLYQVKWCCIMLNEFLGLGIRRRQFAGHVDRTQRKREQLDKVYELLSQIACIEQRL